MAERERPEEPPRRGFELEPEEPAAPRRVPEPVAPVAPVEGPKPAARTTAPEPVRDGSAAPEGEREIDTRTFAEKRGQAVARVAGPRPPPQDWPREALGFPLRGAGLGYLLAASGALFALDLLVWTEGLRFLSWLLKIPALLFVVRWQLDLAGMSAGGQDAPVGFARALGLDRGGLGVFGKLVLWMCITLLPGRVLWLLGPSVLGLTAEHTAWEVGLTILGSVWLAVVAVSVAVSEPHLLRPWHTLVWIARRPLALLVGSVGWWALGCAEVAVMALAGEGNWTTLPAGIVLRVASIYLVMLSARALGVVGRSV